VRFFETRGLVVAGERFEVPIRRRRSARGTSERRRVDGRDLLAGFGVAASGFGAVGAGGGDFAGGGKTWPVDWDFKGIGRAMGGGGEGK